jgi:hypothetical protein
MLSPTGTPGELPGGFRFLSVAVAFVLSFAWPLRAQERDPWIQSIIDQTNMDSLALSGTTLVDGLWQGPGSHKIQLDLAGQPTGVYVYRLRAGNSMFAKRMMYIR